LTHLEAGLADRQQMLRMCMGLIRIPLAILKPRWCTSLNPREDRGSIVLGGWGEGLISAMGVSLEKATRRLFGEVGGGDRGGIPV
jgi:hypothetical protein